MNNLKRDAKKLEDVAKDLHRLVAGFPRSPDRYNQAAVHVANAAEQMEAAAAALITKP